MDITKVKLEGDLKSLLDVATSRVASVQCQLDELTAEFQEKAKELEVIKAKIRPLKTEISNAAQIQAGIASRKSRAKYFPEFATKNYEADEKKDKAFEDMAREALK